MQLKHGGFPAQFAFANDYDSPRNAWALRDLKLADPHDFLTLSMLGSLGAIKPSPETE